VRSIITAFLLTLCTYSSSAHSARWYLVYVEEVALYSAVAAYRVESTLIQVRGDLVTLWVRTDFVRPQGYKYPKKPLIGPYIQTDTLLWSKSRYVIDCRTKKIDISGGSHVIANDNVEWDNNSKENVEVSPDSIFEIAYKMACYDSQPRKILDIERLAIEVESRILVDSREQERIRKEKNIPKVRI